MRQTQTYFPIYVPIISKPSLVTPVGTGRSIYLYWLLGNVFVLAQPGIGRLVAQHDNFFKRMSIFGSPEPWPM